MSEKQNGNIYLKWFITIVASLLLVFSTVVRVMNGDPVDKTLCLLFGFIAGLPWGANIFDYIIRR